MENWGKARKQRGRIGRGTGGNLEVTGSGEFPSCVFRSRVVKRERINRNETRGNDIFAIRPHPGASATPLVEFLGHIGCSSCHIRLGSAKGLLRGSVAAICEQTGQRVSPLEEVQYAHVKRVYMVSDFVVAAQCLLFEDMLDLADGFHVRWKGLWWKVE